MLIQTNLYKAVGYSNDGYAEKLDSTSKVVICTEPDRIEITGDSFALWKVFAKIESQLRKNVEEEVRAAGPRFGVDWKVYRRDLGIEE